MPGTLQNLHYLPQGMDHLQPPECKNDEFVITDLEGRMIEEMQLETGNQREQRADLFIDQVGLLIIIVVVLKERKALRAVTRIGGVYACFIISFITIEEGLHRISKV